MEYILDVAKWRCGAFGPHRLGVGETHMLNTSGFSCCLGQFALQLGVKKENLLGVNSPRDAAIFACTAYDDTMVNQYEFGGIGYRSSQLATGLMGINDDTKTTAKKKITLIRKELEDHGHSLKVINEDIL